MLIIWLAGDISDEGDGSIDNETSDNDSYAEAPVRRYESLESGDDEARVAEGILLSFDGMSTKHTHTHPHTPTHTHTHTHSTHTFSQIPVDYSILLIIFSSLMCVLLLSSCS